MKHGLILSGYDSFYYFNFQGNKIHLNVDYIPSVVTSNKYSVEHENNEGEKTLVGELNIVAVYSILGSVALKLNFRFCCLKLKGYCFESRYLGGL